MNTSGSCLCGEVEYEFSGTMGVFQYCHCSRCRKFTGSAHAANIFVKKEQFQWLKGEHLLQRFEPENTKYFATCFCGQCGSSLPWLSKNNKVMVIPAGTLNTDPGIEPQQNIFWGSRASWFICPSELIQHDELPPR